MSNARVLGAVTIESMHSHRTTVMLQVSLTLAFGETS